MIGRSDAIILGNAALILGVYWLAAFELAVVIALTLIYVQVAAHSFYLS